MKFNEFMGTLRRNPVKHVYLLAGEEPYYINRAKEGILERLFPDPESRENGLVLMPEDPPVEELIGSIQTVPFFSDRNVVLVEHTNLFREKKAAKKGDGEADGGKPAKNPRLEQLIELLSDMPEDSFVIFATEAKADKRRKLYKAVEKAGAVLDADPVRPWNINEWLQGKLQSINKDLDREGRAYFANAVSMMQQVSLGYLDREFDKLALFAKGRMITKQDLETAFSDLPEVSLFALMDAVSERSARKALLILGRQVRDGAYLPLVLGLLVRHVRMLWQARILMGQGCRGKDLAKPLELNPFIAERLGKSAQAFSEEVLRDAFLELADADYGMKSGQAGLEKMEHAIIRLCRD